MDKRNELLLTLGEEEEAHSEWRQLSPDTRISWRDYWLTAQLAKVKQYDKQNGASISFPEAKKQEREKLEHSIYQDLIAYLNDKKDKK